jgi:hypothetical protein
LEPSIPKVSRPNIQVSEIQSVRAALENPTRIPQLRSLFPKEEPMMVTLENAVRAMLILGGGKMQALSIRPLFATVRLSPFNEKALTVSIHVVKLVVNKVFNFDTQSLLSPNRDKAIV